MLRLWAVLLLVVSLPVAAQEAGETLWKQLLASNTRYVGGKLAYDDLVRQRNTTPKPQAPPIAVLSCADSRVPPELIFYRSIGDLFVLRVAGNVADPFVIASLEYALLQPPPIWPQLIVVMGHEDCGAVHSALKQTNPPSPSLVSLVDEIRGSFTGIPVVEWNPDSTTIMRRATEANAKASANALIARSEIIRQAVRSGRTTIITAYYSLDGSVVRVP